MSCLKGVMLMLLYTEIQTVTFGRMDTNNAHFSKPNKRKILVSENHFVDTLFWQDALDMF
jgi:hypothetical protein